MKPYKDKGIYRSLYFMLTKSQKWSFVAIGIIMIVSAILSQMLPLAIGSLTDDIMAKNNLNFLSVIPFLIFILVITVFNEIIKIVRRLLVENTATGFEKEARIRAISSILKAPLSYFRENMVGNIHGKLNRSLEGTTKLLKLIFMDLAPAIVTALAAVVVIFSKMPFLLACLIILVVPFGILLVFRQISTQKGIRVELLEQKSTMDGTTVELINGIEVIRICDTVQFELGRFQNKSEYLRSKEMKHHKAMALYDCLKFVNEAIFTVIVIGASAYLASKNSISVGTVLTSYLCFTQLTTPLHELHRILDELSEASVLASEYFKITKLKEDFSYHFSPPSEKYPHSDVPMLQIRNVNFSYQKNETNNILCDFNLDIEKGSFVGIAGPSGCGKSSLIKVLCKLEQASGTILIDGCPIEQLTRSDISSYIALVPQSPFLIAGTIRENICYGIEQPVSDQDIKLAAHRACIDQFIESLPDEYDSFIAEGGGNLSGGQKQRIAIARIFLRKPKLLILDEATSALDNTSEKTIQQEIERLQKENHTTILSIAHRLTTLQNCDRILVLNQGKIEQEGTYLELISKPGIFSDMYHGVLK